MKLGQQSSWRRKGCIVTWRDDDGVDHSVTESGEPLRALQAIIKKTPIPPGGIRTISTWRSILRDLSVMPRVYGGNRKGAWMPIDPYAYERSLLSKIKRLDLLCDDAYVRERTH